MNSENKPEVAVLAKQNITSVVLIKILQGPVGWFSLVALIGLLVPAGIFLELGMNLSSGYINGYHGVTATVSGFNAYKDCNSGPTGRRKLSDGCFWYPEVEYYIGGIKNTTIVNGTTNYNFYNGKKCNRDFYWIIKTKKYPTNKEDALDFASKHGTVGVTTDTVYYRTTHRNRCFLYKDISYPYELGVILIISASALTLICVFYNYNLVYKYNADRPSTDNQFTHIPTQI